MNLVTRVKNALIKASTSYTSDIRRAYKRALKREEDENAAWVLKLILVFQRETLTSNIFSSDSFLIAIDHTS